MRPSELDIAEHVREIAAEYEHDANQKGLRLETNVAPSLGMTADPDLLIDALGNLVQNAVKYTAAGSVEVEAEADRDDIVFCVRDTGAGIPADRFATLFDGAQPGGEGGAGIGLLIACRAARAMGGSVEAESELGRGSTFRLRLPSRVAPRERP